MAFPKVSILTPTFNHEGYIGECIESVLNQTDPNWEMIIIDDGSTDRTPDIIRQYNDPRIIFIRKDHRGIEVLGENYNHALEISRGEYILILEGDDFLPPDRIELQLPSFKDEKVVLSHGKYAYVLNEKVVAYPCLFKSDELNNDPPGSAFKLFLQGFNPIGTQSVMVRKSTLLETGGFFQPAYLPLVDYPTWMRVALKGRFCYIPEMLGYWRRHALSITMNQNERIFQGFLKYCDEFITVFDSELAGFNLTKFVKNRGAIAYLSLAWIRLSHQDWENALEFSKRAWNRNEVLSSTFRMKTLMAMISACLHTDIPGFLKRIRELFYQKRMTGNIGTASLKSLD